jgi:arginyl-tRNA synthetase
MTASHKIIESTSLKIGEDLWNKIKAIWSKLQPKVMQKEAAQEAAIDLAQNPDHEDCQVALRLQLKKILEANQNLAMDIHQILQEELASAIGDNIQMSGTSYDQSTFKQIGKIEVQGDITL